MNRRDFCKFSMVASLAPCLLKDNKQLYMWTNDCDYIIAETAEEAREIVALLEYGFHPEYPPIEQEKIRMVKAYDERAKREHNLTLEDWDHLDNDYLFTLHHEDGTKEIKPVAQFITQHGKGYFACSEY